MLGDAAHASLPHQGAGAGQAIEDALVLAELLADPRVEEVADIARAFHAYDSIRRPRAQRVASTSRTAGEVCRFEGPMGENQMAIADDLLTRWQWIWDEDMEVQVERAKAVMNPVQRFLER